MRISTKKLGLIAIVPSLATLTMFAQGCGETPPDPPPARGGAPGTGGTTASGGTTVTSGGTTTTSGGTTTTSGGTTSMGGTTTTMGGTTTTMGGTTTTMGGTTTTMGGGGSSSGGTTTTQGGGGSSSGGTTTTQGGGGSSAGGGSTSKGGTTSSGGTSSGGATSGGSAGTSAGGSGGGGDLITIVGKTIDGQMLLSPCSGTTGEQTVCTTKTPNASNCIAGANGGLEAGAHTTDKMIMLGGDPAKVYSITLHIQGVVEAKQYNGGMDAKAAEAVNAKMDGWNVGGTPTGGDAYNHYGIMVTSPKQTYWFNDLIGNAVSDHTTYTMDYTATFKANGGTSIRLLATDSNCSMIKNCGSVKDNACLSPAAFPTADAKAKSLNPTFDFTKAYNGQWVVMVVTAVTEG